jgi:hypothetical protein
LSARLSAATRRLIGLCVVTVLLATPAALAAPAAASNWKLTQLPARSLEGATEKVALYGVSCPTESLCVAVGPFDTLATSTSPTAGAAAWHVVNPSSALESGGSLTAVSCASQSLCAAVGYEGVIDVASEPGGGVGAWSSTAVNEPHAGATHLTGISCPSASLCVAVSGGRGASAGRVLTSTAPTSGHWQTTKVSGSPEFTGVSCGTASFCVAVAKGGQIVVSSDPTGGASAWQVIGAPGGAGDLEGIGCDSGRLCATGNATGNILTSTNPTGAAATWSSAKVGEAALVTGVSCPTAGGCVAVDNNGDVLTSTDPTGGSGAWHAENLVPFEASEGEGQSVHNALFGASCTSTSLCALVGSDSRIFTSTTPFSTTSTTATAGSGARETAHPAPPRPVAKLVFAEHFWKSTTTRRRRVSARFHFYSPTRTKGFECKRDRSPYRRCHSPLRYWVGIGHHVLRVRAIGPTGLRGRPAIQRFRVGHPRAAR